MSEEELNKLKEKIGYMLDGKDYHSNKEYMLSVSQYYRYMSESIASDDILIDCDKDLLVNFEAIYLWLQEQLAYVPSHLKDQVEEIFKTAKLCELFAILSSLSDKEIWSINRRRRLNSSVGIFTSLFSRRSHSDLEESQLVSGSHLVEAKVALTRLCQVTKFASSKVENDFYSDDGFESYSNRYNPEMINKIKVVALVNLLKSQLSEVDQNDDVRLLLEKLDEVEKELGKRRPHWGLIFSTLFVIFGFTADLKTLDPTIYSKAHKTIEAILFNLHEEGQVEKNTVYNLPQLPTEKDGTEDKYAIFRKDEIEPVSDDEQ
ncbi:hypothetical protein ACJJIE_11880 [Microbulbifer sp. TRSA001]|uniref:hypothetical protein n=1 Tax=Microbulbifer sp. TRSA001 TaxID=3243381 RepID=UPI00403A6E9E